MTTSNTTFPMWDRGLQSTFIELVTGLEDDRYLLAAKAMIETGIRPSDAVSMKGCFIDVVGDHAYLELPISKQTNAVYTKSRNAYIKKQLLTLAEDYKNLSQWDEYYSLVSLTSSKPVTKIKDGLIIEDGKKTWFGALHDPRLKGTEDNGLIVLRGLYSDGDQRWADIVHGASLHGDKCKQAAIDTKKTTKRISKALALDLLALNDKTDDDYIFSSELSRSNNKGQCSNQHMTRQALWLALSPIFKQLTDGINNSNKVKSQIPFKLSVYSLRKTAAYNVFVGAMAKGKDALAAARDFLNHSESTVTKRYLMMFEKLFMMFEDGNFKMA